ncbi:MAG: C2 family cysteine protease, partial [Alphaproteobacteria bacterium]|nr:C2 family cysteine protease [Alphaproteobacteria bacterium]
MAYQTLENFDGTELYNTSGNSAGQPNLSDIQQGGYGDCYFLAELGSLVRSDPDAVKSMIQDNSDGTYTVSFHQEGTDLPLKVTVGADDISVNAANLDWEGGVTDKSDGDRIIWPTIIEAAYMKLGGGYQEFGGTGEPYFQVDAGGEPYSALLTGNSDDGLRSVNELGDLQSQFDSGKLIELWASGEGMPGWDGLGLVDGHAYTVTNVYTTANGEFVSLNNPWGVDSPADISVADLVNCSTSCFLTGTDGSYSNNWTAVGNVPVTDNVVYDRPGDDVLTGTTGNDRFVVYDSYGIDTIDGGAGYDTVVFQGKQSDYTISYDSSTATYTFADRYSTEATAKNVELYQFSDGAISESDLRSMVDPVPTPTPDPVPTPDPDPVPTPTPDPVPTPTPDPVPTPTPDPVPTPTPDPVPTPTPDPVPTPTPDPVPTPTPDPVPTPTPDPVPTPTPDPVPTPTPDPVPTPTPTPDPVPTPTPTPDPVPTPTPDPVPTPNPGPLPSPTPTPDPVTNLEGNLVLADGHYYLTTADGGTGPMLTLGGVPVTA